MLNKKHIYNTYAAGTNLSASFDPSTAFTSVKHDIGAYGITEIRLHASNYIGSGEFVATLDAAAGAYYDDVVCRQSLAGIRDFAQYFDPPFICKTGDIVTLTTNNSQAGINVGCTVVIVEL